MVVKEVVAPMSAAVAPITPITKLAIPSWLNGLFDVSVSVSTIMMNEKSRRHVGNSCLALELILIAIFFVDAKVARQNTDINILCVSPV